MGRGDPGPVRRRFLGGIMHDESRPEPIELPVDVAPVARPPHGPIARWLLEGHTQEVEGPEAGAGTHAQHPWWQVMCLTGVDYFSTLGYQPGIAALAAGALSPIATLILVLLTLFGALPIYGRVAEESPHGEGSIAMLEHLLSWWQGKLFVLALLGFVATDFIITITLSAADATAHVVENPILHPYLEGQEIPITLLLIVGLGGVFLRGFKEAIRFAIILVGVYLLLNATVIGLGLSEVAKHPELIREWRVRLFAIDRNPLMLLGFSLLLFPKLALGMSGFETGVAVMPLIEGGEPHAEPHAPVPAHPGVGPKAKVIAVPEGRIRNTRKLLVTAALIMSCYLISSSIVTTALIPPEQFQKGGDAYGRALAYLAHESLGEGFGTVYDISTILILWFAGASAMAGLLNIVPRYLPRFGMAPEWTRAVRPLVLIYTTIALVVTIIFKADVEAQGGAYATGVLVLMSSAAIAVTISAWRRGRRAAAVAFALITLVFAYTTVLNIYERPDGVKIASFFIGTIVTVSLVSRVKRSGELRFQGFRFEDGRSKFLWDSLADMDRDNPLIIVPHRPRTGSRPGRSDIEEKESAIRAEHNLADEALFIFVEVNLGDPSEFYNRPILAAGQEEGRFVLQVSEAVSAAHTLAAIVLELSKRGKPPRVYLGWSEEDNPWLASLGTLLFGEGDVPTQVRRLLKRAQPIPELRPRVYVVG